MKELIHNIAIEHKLYKHPEHLNKLAETVSEEIGSGCAYEDKIIKILCEDYLTQMGGCNNYF
jgi:hypothetical protein